MANEQDIAIAYEFKPPQAKKGKTGQPDAQPDSIPGVGKLLTKTQYDDHCAAGRIDPKTEPGSWYKSVTTTGGTAASKPKEDDDA